MINNIKFIPRFDIPKEYYPQPASSFVPDWYKELESYKDNVKKPFKENAGSTPASIKRCMPVFDSLNSGYIITSYVDVWVHQEEEPSTEETSNKSSAITNPYYQWPSFTPIQFHPVEQAPTYPDRGEHRYHYPKWINPWGIKTPTGYSCLFVPPFHRDAVFTILPAIVDTDTYSNPVNFPFVLKNANTFDGLIPAGTPIAQVIPFKRDSWQMTIGDTVDAQESQEAFSYIRGKFFDAYKIKFRQPKEYR